jgi:hypothetical protein
MLVLTLPVSQADHLALLIWQKPLARAAAEVPRSIPNRIGTRHDLNRSTPKLVQKQLCYINTMLLFFKLMNIGDNPESS